MKIVFLLLETFLDILERFKGHFWKVHVKQAQTSIFLLELFLDVLERLKGHICNVRVPLPLDIEGPLWANDFLLICFLPKIDQ